MFTVVKTESEHISMQTEQPPPLRHSCWYTLMCGRLRNDSQEGKREGGTEIKERSMFFSNSATDVAGLEVYFIVR